MNVLTQAYRATCVPQRGDRLDEESQPEYNAETLAAMQEARDIMAGRIQTKKYKTVEEMDADIDAEDDDDA